MLLSMIRDFVVEPENCAYTEYLRTRRMTTRSDVLERGRALLRALAWNLDSVLQCKEMQECGHGDPDLVTEVHG
jgi:hypothetical protein